MLVFSIYVLPWEDTPETKREILYIYTDIFFIYVYIKKRERKQREGEIQRQIFRGGKDYIIFLQSCNSLPRIYVT